MLAFFLYRVRTSGLGHLPKSGPVLLISNHISYVDVVVLQLAYLGTPSSTRIYSVTEDGSTLTETKAAFHKDGTPFLQTTTFKRLP